MVSKRRRFGAAFKAQGGPGGSPGRPDGSPPVGREVWGHTSQATAWKKQLLSGVAKVCRLQPPTRSAKQNVRNIFGP